mmetsp:Transcript_46683/g.101384  ORF Transcript_46683/g.101384 Transcript_46683/m.101384 type:complete len:205 (+) Transcript_46683:477-1091(+)
MTSVSLHLMSKTLRTLSGVLEEGDLAVGCGQVSPPQPKRRPGTIGHVAPEPNLQQVHTRCVPVARQHLVVQNVVLVGSYFVRNGSAAHGRAIEIRCQFSSEVLQKPASALIVRFEESHTLDNSGRFFEPTEAPLTHTKLQLWRTAHPSDFHRTSECLLCFSKSPQIHECHAAVVDSDRVRALAPLQWNVALGVLLVLKNHETVW